MCKILVILLALSLTSACSLFRPYQQPIQQGNIISLRQFDRLKTGMTESEVKRIMGEPILVNAFSSQRLDYVYTFKSCERMDEKTAVLTFRNKRLVKIEKTKWKMYYSN